MKETRIGDFEEVILLLVGILGEEAYSFRIADEFESQTARQVSPLLVVTMVCIELYTIILRFIQSVPV